MGIRRSPEFKVRSDFRDDGGGGFSDVEGEGFGGDFEGVELGLQEAGGHIVVFALLEALGEEFGGAGEEAELGVF